MSFIPISITLCSVFASREISTSDVNSGESYIFITKKGSSWGKRNLERNVQFVSELFGGIPAEDIRTFADVQKQLLKKLTDMKEQFRTEGSE